MQLFQALWTISGQEYDFGGVYPGSYPTGVNFRGTKRDQDRWWISVYVQDGSWLSFIATIRTSYCSSVSSPGQRNRRASHKRGHDSPACVGIWESSARRLEPISSLGSANLELHDRWINWYSASEGHLRRSRNFGHRAGRACRLGWTKSWRLSEKRFRSWDVHKM